MRKLIRTDGTTLDLPTPLTLDEIRELIGAKTLDFVTLAHMGMPLHVMAVDDNGYETQTVTEGNHTTVVPIKALKPVNLAATCLYHLECTPGTLHQIVGDVVIAPDEDYEE
jgi:hypothetical protein